MAAGLEPPRRILCHSHWLMNREKVIVELILYVMIAYSHTHTNTRLVALFPGLPRWAGTRKVKPIWIFTEARDSEWQWHQLGHMQVCTSLQTDNYASTPPLSFFTGRLPFLPPNQQRQSTEGIDCLQSVEKKTDF